MTTDQITPEIQTYFDTCGLLHGQERTANAEKVRRVIHLAEALSGHTMPELWILDLATGHGTYAIEFGLQGAGHVLGLDARWERMSEAMKIADTLGLKNVCFEQADVRSVNQNDYGEWDIVLLLGILYHLPAEDACLVLENLSEMAPLLIIDTFVGAGSSTFNYNGQAYRGQWTREHRAGDSAEVKRARVRSSIDNEVSWRWHPESLWRLLASVGYNVVLEARVPLEPQKPRNRVTLACLRQDALPTCIYPWLAPGGGPP